MEAFEIHFKIPRAKKKPRSFFWKAYAATGWEAAKKAEQTIRQKIPNTKNIRFHDWEVLDPGQSHFQ